MHSPEALIYIAEESHGIFMQNLIIIINSIITLHVNILCKIKKNGIFLINKVSTNGFA